MRRYVVLGAFLVASVVAVRPAAACSCIPNPSPEEAFNKADIVFAGRVLEIKNADGEAYPAALDVRLWIERPFKGFFIETIRVRTARDGASCGFPFEEDERYLIYAHSDDEGTLHVSLCSRTAHLRDARADLIAFDALDLLDEEEDDDDGDGGCGGLTNAAAMQAAVFIFFIVVLQRRRRV